MPFFLLSYCFCPYKTTRPWSGVPGNLEKNIAAPAAETDVEFVLQRIEEIKNKRQAHHIFQRMKAAKKIQKAKDIREVERDLALIKSPAAGLKKANLEMTEQEMEDDTEVDTSINMKIKQKLKAREEAKLEEIHESDQEMEANE